MAFISPPNKLPFYIRVGLWLARKMTGQDFLIIRLLGWYPKAALSSSILEGLIAHNDGEIDERMLKLVRMAVSFTVGCPYCMDMNSAGWEKVLTTEELAAIQGRIPVEEVSTLSGREKMAIQYARLVSSNPQRYPAAFITELKAAFSERGIVILATTAVQVNYWARLIQSLGCPPVGISGSDFFLDINWPSV